MEKRRGPKPLDRPQPGDRVGIYTYLGEKEILGIPWIVLECTICGSNRTVDNWRTVMHTLRHSQKCTHQKSLTKEQVQEIDEKILQGISLRKIANEYGQSLFSVRKRMHLLPGIVRRKKPKRLSKEEVEIFKEKFSQGVSLHKIAKELGVTPAPLYTLRSTFFPYKKREITRFSSQQLAEIKEKLASGETPEAIAAQYGTTSEKIKQRGPKKPRAIQPKRVSLAVREEIKKRLLEGGTLQNIAYATNTSINTVFLIKHTMPEITGEESRDSIRKMLREGKSILDICTELNVSSQKVGKQIQLMKKEFLKNEKN